MESAYIGKKLEELPSPVFVVDLEKVKKNCTVMLERASNYGLILRGHVKTHKSVDAGILQTGGTKRCLVVSTLPEAEMYAEAGFDDILYGYPVMKHHMERNYDLCKRLERYHVMVSSVEGLKMLIEHAPPEGKKWSFFLDVDSGYGRTGILWTDVAAIKELATTIKRNGALFSFQGVYAHCGNTYEGKSVEEVCKLRDGSIAALNSVKGRFLEEGVDMPHVGTGSTPSCSHQGEKYGLLTEIHPGNYVFYDYMQYKLGSCSESDIAGLVMTRVVEHHPERNQLIVDCGFTALTKQGYTDQGNAFALIKGHPEIKLCKMTQEIGFIEPIDKSGVLDCSKYPVGSVLFLMPYHACATAGMHPVYYVHEKGTVKDTWKPCRGW